MWIWLIVLIQIHATVWQILKVNYQIQKFYKSAENLINIFVKSLEITLQSFSILSIDVMSKLWYCLMFHCQFSGPCSEAQSPEMNLNHPKISWFCHNDNWWKSRGKTEKASSELIFGAFFPCENSVQPSLRQQLSTLEKYRTIFARHDDCNPRQNCPIYSYKYMPRCHIQTLFMLMLQ